MARVTVEDCLKNVKNRFELVIIAAKRARQLMRGKDAHVEWDNDKSTVVALREIAAGYTDFDHHDIHEDDHKVAPSAPVAAQHEEDEDEEDESSTEHSEALFIEQPEKNDHIEERDEE